MHEDEPTHVDAGRAVVDHLPVEYRSGCEFVEQNIARSGITPIENCGAGIFRTMRGKPFESALDDRQSEIAARPVVVRTLFGQKATDVVARGGRKERQVEAVAPGSIEIDGVNSRLKASHRARKSTLVVHAETVEETPTEHVGRHVG